MYMKPHSATGGRLSKPLSSGTQPSQSRTKDDLGLPEIVIDPTGSYRPCMKPNAQVTTAKAPGHATAVPPVRSRPVPSYVPTIYSTALSKPSAPRAPAAVPAVTAQTSAAPSAPPVKLAGAKRRLGMGHNLVPYTNKKFKLPTLKKQ